MITSWIDLLTDAAPVKAVFGELIPTLDGARVHDIVLDREGGPQVLLRFELQEFPQVPPKKWVAAGFNRVQLQLAAIGIRDLQISGWESKVKINLHVEKQGAFVRVFADNGSVSFGIEADFLSVQKISGYAACNERK